MQKLWAQAMLLVALSAPAMAAETTVVETAPPEMVVVRVEMLQLSGGAASALGGKSFFPGGYKGDRGRTLQTSELMVQTSKESLLALGRKFPITYFDPRASQFQVQYIDTGMKVDVTVTPAATGGYRVESYNEFAETEMLRTGGTPIIAAYPQTNVFSSHTDKSGVNIGDALVLGTVDGPSAQRCLKSIAGVDGTGGDSVVMIMTLLRP